MASWVMFSYTELVSEQQGARIAQSVYLPVTGRRSMAWCSTFSPLQVVHAHAGAYSDSYPLGTGDAFLGTKAANWWRNQECMDPYILCEVSGSSTGYAVGGRGVWLYCSQCPDQVWGPLNFLCSGKWGPIHWDMNRTILLHRVTSYVYIPIT
jgi:hypothetical protein